MKKIKINEATFNLKLKKFKICKTQEISSQNLVNNNLHPLNLSSSGRLRGVIQVKAIASRDTQTPHLMKSPSNQIIHSNLMKYAINIRQNQLFLRILISLTSPC